LTYSEGKWKYEELEDKEEIELPYCELGYMPEIVVLLVEALGGNYDSV